MSQRQTTSIPKISRCRHAISSTLNPISSTNFILSIRNVPKVSSDIQVSFQPFTENKGLPCRGRFLGPAAGYSWAAAGGKQWGEEEEDYWKPLVNLPTCWPVEWETPAQPCPAQSKPALSNAPVSTTSCTSIKFMPTLLFWPPKIIFAGHWTRCTIVQVLMYLS